MLDEYFAEQMKEIIKQCCRSRQTLLFSATMSTEVQDLAAVSLKDPVKVIVVSFFLLLVKMILNCFLPAV